MLIQQDGKRNLDAGHWVGAVNARRRGKLYAATLSLSLRNLAAMGDE